MKLNPENRKAAIRRALREQLRQLPPEVMARDSERLRQLLLEQVIWREARTVLLFAPAAGEPDVWPLLVEALRSGKAVALPRLDAGTGQYQAGQVVDLGADVVCGAFGLREPSAACPELPLNRLDFALVPGVGFTLDGGRLGRGQGYLDRLLSAVPGFKCGVAFDCQVVPELPMEPHDVHLNGILTPTRWHLTAGRARY